MTESTYGVIGMSCGHCASFVTEEIERIPGVTAVAIDVDSGRVSVTSDRDLSLTTVRAAVEEAGYELAATAPPARPGMDVGSSPVSGVLSPSAGGGPPRQAAGS
ncbi:copper chaperone [Actinomadura sp. KC345]|uniref:heavy-metal-associated domain-containing protein n=1 Tax=Actinomadura sp. KC345 TaxID=2530371 RepID=UPI00104BB769|nr:copper chaperone [Actinomadura sp. KC345]